MGLFNNHFEHNYCSYIPETTERNNKLTSKVPIKPCAHRDRGEGILYARLDDVEALNFGEEARQK